MNLRLRLLLTCGAVSLPAALATAQTPTSTATPRDADIESVEMDKMEITDSVPIERLILPTSRPFASVFGSNDNIVDVPRNVTIISRQQLNDISISDVRDFSKLTSSSFTTTNFGAPANPSIRGQISDMFINGVRSSITSNGNGIPLDFNSVESVNIVKGPASAVQGTSMYVGGFVDLITKRPTFEKFKGSISYTTGTYGVNKGTVDIGGPVSNTVAYRISYSGEYSEGYWYDWYKRTNSLYGAVTWRPNDHYEMFVNASVYYGDYTENWGINRVTQDLIDNGNYITGVNINNNGAPAVDPQNSTNVIGSGNIIAWGPTVELDRRIRLFRPRDNSVARFANFQIIQTEKVSPTFSIKNTTFASYTKRDTLSTYYYSEVIDPSFFAENRTELIYQTSTFTVNAGVDLRYQRTKAYDDYFYEPVNVWDLSRDRSYINVYNSADFLQNGGFPVPGWANRFAQPGLFNGDTNDSRSYTVGPFVQSNFKVSEKLAVIIGGRADFFHAKVREPLLPPYLTDEIDVINANTNGSLVFKPTVNSSLYFTYNYSENTSGAIGNGGGITGWNDAATALDKEKFKQPSELFEIGSKYSLLEGKLFMNMAAFTQTRTAKSTSSTVINQYKYKGIEAELNWQPNKNFYMTASASFLDADASAGFQYGLFGGITEMAPGNTTNPVVPIGTGIKLTGVPEYLFNGLVNYTFDNGFGMSANILVTSKINNNTTGTLVIPSQYSIDASAFYAWKNYDFRVTLLNATNEKNWAPPNEVYGNGSLLALPGTEVHFTIRMKF